jgi:hypothetical protein
MRKALLTITMIMIMILAGCSNDDPEILQTQENPVKDKPTIILKEEEPEPEPIIYGLGERAVVREDYAVTILSVEDTEYKIPWRPEQKNIVVEVLFENLSMDKIMRSSIMKRAWSLDSISVSTMQIHTHQQFWMKPTGMYLPQLEPRVFTNLYLKHRSIPTK